MTLDESEILKQCARYCSAAERCRSDVKKRLDTVELDDAAKESILHRLVKEGFIDEVRYSRAFVNDKFRFNQWGRTKIVFELKNRGIASSTINSALEEIDSEVYTETLQKLLVKKKKTIKAETNRELLTKLHSYATSKGFESDMAFKLIVQITGIEDETMD